MLLQIAVTFILNQTRKKRKVRNEDLDQDLESKFTKPRVISACFILTTVYIPKKILIRSPNIELFQAKNV